MMVRRAALAALLIAAVLSAGCSSLPFFKPKADASAQTPAPAPVVAVYRLEVSVDAATPSAEGNPIRLLLTAYLDLARFQTAPASEGIDAAELDRLIAASKTQARALIETEGYFNSTVDVARAGSAPDGLPLVRMQVRPGPRTRVLKLALDATGELKRSADAGNVPAATLLGHLRRDWALPVGQPFRQSLWGGAKNGTLAQLRAEGYPAATWQSTAATVDAEANTVALDLLLDSGTLFKLGPLRVEGLQRYPASAVERLAIFGPGTPYSEKLLLDFQERLQKSNLFEGAAVEIEPDVATAAATPVLVRVRELPLQQATVGAGISANTGARVTLEHTHRQPFGWNWIAKNKFEYGGDLKSWTGDLTSYPLDNLYRNLVGGSAERLRTADELRTSWSVRVGRTQETPRLDRLYYAEYTHVRLDTTGPTQNNDAASLNYHWIKRAVDNVLLPTDGYTLSAQGALGYALSDTAKDGPFARAYSRLTWYRPFGNGWHATVRGEGGQVFSGANVGVPDTILFRAGGDDSVRGYGYRTLGPTVDGAVVSGRVLLTGSAEVARPISPKYPAFWWATFVDAGNAADRWGKLTPAVGVGVGLRWRSPVGPLRLDLAYGEKVKAFRVHFSVGVSL